MNKQEKIKIMEQALRAILSGERLAFHEFLVKHDSLPPSTSLPMPQEDWMAYVAWAALYKTEYL